MGTKRDFGTKDVIRLAGIPYQTLDRWLKAGYLTAEVPAEGTGSRRRYSFREVVLAVVARTLQEHGLRPGAGSVPGSAAGRPIQPVRA